MEDFDESVVKFKAVVGLIVLSVLVGYLVLFANARGINAVIPSLIVLLSVIAFLLMPSSWLIKIKRKVRL